MSANLQSMAENITERLTALLAEYQRQRQMGILSKELSTQLGAQISRARISMAVLSLTSKSTALLTYSCDLAVMEKELRQNAALGKRVIPGINQVVDDAIKFARSEQFSPEMESELVEELMSCADLKAAKRLLGQRKKDAIQKHMAALKEKIKASTRPQDSVASAPILFPQAADPRLQKLQREAGKVETHAALSLYWRAVEATSRRDKIRLFGAAIQEDRRQKLLDQAALANRSSQRAQVAAR